jgi:hypothetical protein
MIELFSEWIELAPFFKNNNEGFLYAFLDKVLNRFGAPPKNSQMRAWNFKNNFWSCVSGL